MDRKSPGNFKYAALEHGLSSRHSLHPDGVTDDRAFANLLTAYRTDYAPESVAETEAVFSLVETQWQLTRVRRLLDLAFSRGGDLLATARMIDLFSRHQYRLHRMVRDHIARLDYLMNQRDPGDAPPANGHSGFVSQKAPAPRKPPMPAQSGFASQQTPEPRPRGAHRKGAREHEPDSGFVSQNDPAPLAPLPLARFWRRFAAGSRHQTTKETNESEAHRGAHGAARSAA